MFVTLAVLLASLVVLAKSAEYLVDQALVLAKFFRIGQMAVGFILISLSTSLPELMVSVMSSTRGEGALSVGNAVGSNIADLCIVIGVAAFLFGVRVLKSERRALNNILFVTSAVAILLLALGGLISPFVGVVLLIVFALWTRDALAKPAMELELGNHVTRAQAGKALGLFFVALVFLLVSSNFAVDAAVSLAEQAGLAKSFIGATIVAIGTSFPELAVDLTAVRKKKYALALGDAVGSCMVNLTLVLGTAAILGPVTVTMAVFAPILVFLLAANLVFYVFINTRTLLAKPAGLALFVFYLIFIIVISDIQFLVVLQQQAFLTLNQLGPAVIRLASLP